MARSLRGAIGHATRNRATLSNAERAACYYCLAIFSPAEIIDWVDEEQTALCPRCGIDSVLPDSAGYEFTQEELRELRQFWFERSAESGSGLP